MCQEANWAIHNICSRRILKVILWFHEQICKPNFQVSETSCIKIILKIRLFFPSCLSLLLLQFSLVSVTQSYPTLCNPMNHCTPGLPVPSPTSGVTWGFPLSVSYHFAFSYCSWGSQGKNTEVACHSPLQWTTFCQTSPPWPARLGWPHRHGLVSLS